MQSKTNKYLVTALLLGIIFHGTTMFFTVERTYDALIHLFFANHYANSWFEPWNYSWYTGFTVTGYPPLVHQAIAAFSYVGGLKFGMFTVALIGVVLFITGVYRFTQVLIPNKKVAGYAAILAVFSSSFVETLHIFGQLPSIIGISVLMHCLPEIYLWVKTAHKKHLIKALALLSVTVTSHHVTPIFGMVFFIFPLLGMVIMDAAREEVGSFQKVTFIAFAKALKTHILRIIGFGGSALVLIIGCILPYWLNTKNNPITQVPIPYGSRDNFLEVLSSGLVFFVIPWGLLLFLLPYFFYRYFSKRLLFFGISFSLLLILGTGGTTPIPLAILGDNAFNILTLDRFTLWASIMALPVFGEFCYRFVEGDYKSYLQQKWGVMVHRSAGAFLALLFILMSIFTMTLGKFRPSQPDPIKMTPIVNFLNEDEHYKWRYLPLGFGDQMAWLSAQTKATTVDGDYHSARRLPELTTRAVERLENSKYRGIEGIGSLQQFLTIPEKYHLKYVFSNDKFYDPLLYFTGWHRLSLLENGIMVWEKAGIAPLPSVLPKEDLPLYLKLMWGIIPFATVLLSFLIYLNTLWQRSFIRKNKRAIYFNFSAPYKTVSTIVYKGSVLWAVLLLLSVFYGAYRLYIENIAQLSPKNVLTAYYDALDFKEFERAHSYINPNSGKSLSQFMLEISVSDGLLSSYAKLDSLHIDVETTSDTTAIGRINASWITPLKEIETGDKLSLERLDDKWFITPKVTDPDIPPDQLLIQSSTAYYNHGKRTVTSQKTFHKDVLKQPVVEIISAKLVVIDSTYALVGEIQNVDNIPADISVAGALYNSSDQELARFNAKDIIKHKLLPKETTLFRVNFEEVAWRSATDNKPSTFDPNAFSAIHLAGIPEKFEIQVSANVATEEIYPTVGISQIRQLDKDIGGALFNTSIHQATIAQLLIGYYNEQKDLLWVEAKYIDESVRQQRKRPFKEPLYKDQLPIIISDRMDNALVNGLTNSSIAAKVVPHRKDTDSLLQFIEIKNMPYRYITLHTNSYIGNPK
ncbi:MAG: hypothetical protein ABNH00_03840 [Dokdonia sp.]|jgi:hypothetical protein